MLPDDDRIVETCRSILNNFICFNVLKNCALVGIIKTNVFVLATRQSPSLFEAFNQSVAFRSTDLSWWSTALTKRISIFDLPRLSCVVLPQVSTEPTKSEESRRVDPFRFGRSHTC